MAAASYLEIAAGPAAVCKSSGSIISSDSSVEVTKGQIEFVSQPDSSALSKFMYAKGKSYA